MKLRLYHHRDGTRIAYREAGVGPSLCLVHSAGLSHREFVPIVEHLTDRFRLVLPDLPLHGDSEDRPRHPYTLDWLAEVMAAFCRETCGAHPLVGGHGAGAEILLRAVVTGQLAPARLVLMPNRLHCQPARSRLPVPLRALAPAASLPGLDRAARGRAARLPPRARDEAHRARQPRGARPPAPRDGRRRGNANLARSWSRWVRRWPRGRADATLLEAYPRIDAPVLLLWADRDRYHPLAGAEQALDLLPDGQLRVLPGTGFLIAYDDPVGRGAGADGVLVSPRCGGSDAGRGGVRTVGDGAPGACARRCRPASASGRLLGALSSAVPHRADRRARWRLDVRRERLRELPTAWRLAAARSPPPGPRPRRSRPTPRRSARAAST